jgi:23S rRNA (uracil1939-C5)-methyltransferase
VVIAVSCAPATLARDARTLIDAGFSMGPVQPIDQFIYSPHIEAITVFRR